MTRNVSSSFSEVKIQTDVIRKYLGMPIILQLAEDMEQEHDGYTFSGILTDVEDNQINNGVTQKMALIIDKNGIWKIQSNESYSQTTSNSLGGI